MQLSNVYKNPENYSKTNSHCQVDPSTTKYLFNIKFTDAISWREYQFNYRVYGYITQIIKTLVYQQITWKIKWLININWMVY